MEGGKEGKVLSFSWVLFFNGGVGSVRKRQRGGERERVSPPPEGGGFERKRRRRRRRRRGRREVRRIHPRCPLGKRGGWVAGPTVGVRLAVGAP